MEHLENVTYEISSCQKNFMILPTWKGLDLMFPMGISQTQELRSSTTDGFFR
jgi:hypothetical protein